APSSTWVLLNSYAVPRRCTRVRPAAAAGMARVRRAMQISARTVVQHDKRYLRWVASAGDLDTSFDGNGKKVISFGGTDDARAVLVQGNGRIVVAGAGAPANDFCVARLRPN